MRNTENKTPRAAADITEDNLLESAKKAAYSSVKFLYAISPNESNRKLLNGFAHLHKPNNDTADIIQEAAMTLWENLGNPKAVAIARNAVRRYIYAQDKIQVKTISTPLYSKLLKIRKLLKRWNIKITSEQRAELEQIIADKNITAGNIEILIAEEKARAEKSYISANVRTQDLKPRNGGEDEDIVEVEFEDKSDDMNDFITAISHSGVLANIMGALQSSTQHQVLEYMAEEQTPREIAFNMGISEARVSQHRKRIREIALSLYPGGFNEIV
jgi:RNA polymerase sigma factor (sigma-70 family)